MRNQGNKIKNLSGNLLGKQLPLPLIISFLFVPEAPRKKFYQKISFRLVYPTEKENSSLLSNRLR